MIKKKKQLLFFLLIPVLLLAGCSFLENNEDTSSPQEEDFELVTESRFALGTYNQVTLYASEEVAEEVIDAIFERVSEIENAMSLNVEGSDINRLNDARGEAFVTVEEDTFSLLQEGKRVKKETGGTFNIGIGKLIALWDITGSDPKVPLEEDIIKLLPHFDLENLELKDSTLEAKIHDPMMTIDLGGIAKGFAVDEAIKLVQSFNISHAVIDFGGDVFVLGGNPNGNDWRIGISNPFIGESGPVARIFSNTQSIVSSGDYERYFIEDDKLYHHILDPETGYPSDNELNSVTVVSATALEGDILSTALFVMGLEEGLAFIESLEGVEAAFITKEREVHVSTGLIDSFELMDDSFDWIRQ